jgi:uncharacterized membrane-anchored protein
MNKNHMPTVNARYWVAITLASIFGTNMGDLYAHTTQLGIVPGIFLLGAIAAVVFGLERADRYVREVYYWLVIIIIRTGATNIADYLAFRVRIPVAALIGGLAALMCVLAWRAKGSGKDNSLQSTALPDTDAGYWVAMLAAGVFGTVLGDVCSHLVGEGMASLGLGLVLAAVLLWRRRIGNAAGVGLYWLTVATARTAGTAIGDWLAENHVMDIGLPISTLLTGCAFVAVLVMWPRRRPTALLVD